MASQLPDRPLPNSLLIHVQLEHHIVSDFKAFVDKLQDKLYIYFQKNQLSKGCDVKEVSLFRPHADGLRMNVSFNESPSGVQHSLEVESHVLRFDGQSFPLSVIPSSMVIESLQPPPQSPAVPSFSSLKSEIDESFVVLQEMEYQEGESAGNHDNNHSQAETQRGAFSFQRGSSHNAASLMASGNNPAVTWEHAHSEQPLQNAAMQGYGMAPPYSPSGSSTSDECLDPDDRDPDDSSPDDMYGADEEHANKQPSNVRKSLQPHKRNTRGIGRGIIHKDNPSTSKPHPFVPTHPTGKHHQQQGQKSKKSPGQEETKRYPGSAAPKYSREPDPSKDRGSKEEKENESDKEEEVVMVEVSNFKSSTSDDMLKLYFEHPRKSGGGYIETWERDAKTGTIIRFTYENPSLAASVATRTHKVDGVHLTVKQVIKKLPKPSTDLFSEEKKENESDKEEEVVMVEVSNFKLSTSDDMLKLYFEHPRKSGGGYIETWKRDANTGTIIRFTYENPSLAASVAKRTHKVDGVHLTVKQVIKKLPKPSTDLFSEEKKENESGTEEEVVMIEVTDFQSSTSDDMLKLYFEHPRRSGGGYIKTWERDAKTGTIIRFTYENPSLAAVVAKRTHKVDGVHLTVKQVIKKPPKPSTDLFSEEKKENESGTEEEVVMIEVTDFQSSTSDDMLKLYFEHPRRSGGGYIKTWERDAKTGTIIRFTYEKPSLASSVAERTHKVDGAQLTVKLVIKKPPRPVNKRCLFLRGIPDDCNKHHLSCFLGNRSGLDEPTIQYGEMPGTAICTFPEEIPDVEEVIGKICSREIIQNVNLTAEKVHESDCILVQGFSSETSLLLIELYFDNKRRSGGGGVTKVEQGPADGQFVVYFQDWKVVGDVLSTGKLHKPEGQTITVEEYHSNFGRLSSLDAPTPHVPKPVLVQVPADVMEFIFGKGKNTKVKLEMELNKINAVLHWPDGSSKSSARLEPLEDQQRRSSWLKWPENSPKVLKDFLGRCKSAKIPIPRPFWNDVIDKINQLDSREYSIKEDAQRHTVHLAGEQGDISKGSDDIYKIIRDVKDKMEHDAQQIKQDVPLQPQKLQQVILCGIKDKMEKDFPSLKIGIQTYASKKGLLLDGPRKNVQEAELFMRRQMDNLEHVEINTGKNKALFIRNVCDKIHEMLGSQNILAMCSVTQDGRIMIYGAKKVDVTKARAYIGQEITETEIRVEGQAALSVLQSPDGKKLIDDINKQKFAQVELSQAGRIELAGFKTALEEKKQKIMEFLKDNVILKKLVPANKNTMILISGFYGKDITDLMAQHIKNHVAIKTQMSGRNKGFVIQGNKEGVDGTSQAISQLVGGVMEKQYLVSMTGMAQLFHDDKGKKFLNVTQKELECVILESGLDEEGDDEDDDASRGGGRPHAVATKVLSRYALKTGHTLRVIQGDLTKQTVDCIVNAANTKLSNVGGLAAAVLNAGGQDIQKECDQILKRLGRELNEAEPVSTTSGRLPCKKVIHVACQKWQKKTAAYDYELFLYRAIYACLNEANKQKFRSIAIPAISTGVYGFPVHLAVKGILDAVDDFCKNHENQSNVTQIDLTNNDLPTCSVFKQAAMSRFSQFQEYDTMTGTDVDFAGAVGGLPLIDDVPPAPVIMFTSAGPNKLLTNEGITITLEIGSITNQTVDVLINTAGSDMKLSNGAVAKALLQTAGPALQQECDTVTASRGGQIPAGSFIETGTGTLTCKKIYHCVCSEYRQGESEQFLKKLVTSMMEQAEMSEMLSIAIPALGTGNLNYPGDVTACVMYDAILDFSKRYPTGVLTDVRFVVYDKDVKTIKAFEDEIQRLITGVSPGAVGGATGGAPVGRRKLKKSKSTTLSNPQAYSSVQQMSTGGLQTKISAVCLQVAQGDLVRETTNAIVNSVGPNLDLQGPVSKAILASGGFAINKEFDALRKKGLKKLVYVTGSGNLPCDAILHVLTPTTAQEIKTTVGIVLQQAEDNKMKSISFPALGTGQRSTLSTCRSADICAGAMLSAIGEFAVRKKPQHLLLIRLVIFQQNMLPGFHQALHKAVGTSYKEEKGLFSRGFVAAAKSYLNAWTGTPSTEEEEIPQETMILNICAMSMSTLQKATQKIDEFQKQESASEDVPDVHGLFDKMSKEHHAKFKAIEKKNNVEIHVTIDYQGRGKVLRVQGCVLDVKNARIEIQELFTQMQKDETEAQHIEHLAKQVQWSCVSANGIEVYDEEVNALIEDAYAKKLPSVHLDLQDGPVTVDFAQMLEISVRTTLDVQRVDLQKAFEAPSNWVPMTGNVALPTLNPGTAEYIDVQTQFDSTMAGSYTQINDIHRVQNKELLMQYQARQTAIEARLGQTNVEMPLFHGTDEQTCDKINKHGFNRSYCGKNATKYGKGTYFAVKATYSSQDKYAMPNASGIQHMYLAKVLVGEYIRGSLELIAPPVKPNNPDQLYESVVDNVATPEIYVIFHDAQAYPEYLIKFQ